MKKIFILALFTTLTVFSCSKALAIDPPFSQGTIIANANVGFLPGIGVNASGEYVLVDYWWKGHFAVGGYAGYNIRTFKDNDIRYVYSCTSVMPRASYGINITEDFETHAGIMMGFCYRSASWHTQNLQDMDFRASFMFEMAGFAGARYRLTDFLYANAEFVYCSNFSYLYGIRPPYINVGLSFVF